MDKEMEQKKLEYIDALEQANKQLVFALKQCVELLARVRPTLPDKEGWQDLLTDFERIIEVGERTTKEKSFD